MLDLKQNIGLETQQAHAKKSIFSCFALLELPRSLLLSHTETIHSPHNHSISTLILLYSDMMQPVFNNALPFSRANIFL